MIEITPGRPVTDVTNDVIVVVVVVVGKLVTLGCSKIASLSLRRWLH